MPAAVNIFWCRCVEILLELSTVMEQRKSAYIEAQAPKNDHGKVFQANSGFVATPPCSVAYAPLESGELTRLS